MVDDGYSGKTEQYFGFARKEIHPLLPQKCERILEIGCGAGATLKWLKTVFPDSKTHGVEFFAPNAVHLERNADFFWIADVEVFDEEIGTFDLILFLDVLEHLNSPEAVLRKFASLLNPGGIVIVSVPAVSYIGVSLPLLLFRRFSYGDSGILDRTHKRLFVEETAVALLEGAGLAITGGLLGGLHGRKSRLLNALTLGLFRHYLTKQYILQGQRQAGRGSAGIDWKVATYK